MLKWREEDRGFTTPCWIWKLCITDGYGKTWHNGKTRRAHIVVYESVHGTVPKGKVLDHKCRQTMCVNPDHLEPVTSVENARRAISCKLNLSMANEIRELAKDGLTQMELSKIYGVKRNSISDVLNFKTWNPSIQ